MTREPQAMMKSRAFRAVCNTLFFNNLKRYEERETLTMLAVGNRFAQACFAPLLIQQVAIAEHRPAERPGAD